MKRIVIDANIGLAWVLNLPYSQLVEELMKRWQKEQVILAVPMLWQYEVVSGLHRCVMLNLLPQANLLSALAAINGTAIDLIVPSSETDWLALQWARRLDQHKVYDAQYLSLAEQLSAEFWSADLRLANRIDQLGISWVHSVVPT